MSEQWFLKVDGIPGESKDRQHVDEIEVQSWGWGVSTDVLSDINGTVGTGRPRIGTFQFAARTSLATLRLVEACGKGTRVPSATLTGRRVGHSTPVFLTVVLREVLVTSVGLGAGTSQDCLDEVVLHVENVQATYAAQSATGGTGTQVVVQVDPRSR